MIDYQYLKNEYEQMETEDLKELYLSGGLTPLAIQAMQDVLSKRGLDINAFQPSPSGGKKSFIEKVTNPNPFLAIVMTIVLFIAYCIYRNIRFYFFEHNQSAKYVLTIIAFTSIVLIISLLIQRTKK